MMQVSFGVRIRGLDFSYNRPVFKAMSFELPLGSRTLLAGANGVGKSTLLRLLAGRHWVPDGMIEVLGTSPFSDTAVSSEIAFVDHEFPLHVDLSVAELLAFHPGARPVDLRREKQLIDLLGLDPEWRIPKVSEGQKRRIQLALALRHPVKLLLLDEVTAHLDLVIRTDFLTWLKSESEQHGLTIVYATHILDGLGSWPSHLLLLGSNGRPTFSSISDIRELTTESLFAYGERWIREDLLGSSKLS